VVLNSLLSSDFGVGGGVGERVQLILEAASGIAMLQLGYGFWIAFVNIDEFKKI